MSQTVQGTRRPFNSYRDHIQARYGERVQKISVHAGFTCPNRDGSKGIGGCIYCNNDAFIPGYLNRLPSIPEQIARGKRFLTERYGVRKFFVYFQPFSNTYADCATLRRCYRSALEDADVVGLAIGTRPDCIDAEKLDLLQELAEQWDITVEYGLESMFDRTLQLINRGHTRRDFETAVAMTADRGIHIAVHMILGLPEETRDMQLQGAPYLSGLPIDFLKLHHLHIVAGTRLAKLHESVRIPVFSLEEYIALVGEFLQRLRGDIVIQRLVGETNPRRLIAPDWGIRDFEVARRIEAWMVEHGAFQGQLWKP